MLSSRVDKLTRRVSTTYRPLSPLVLPGYWTADLSTNADTPCRQVDKACQHPPALGPKGGEGVARVTGIGFFSWVGGAVGPQPHGPRPTPPPSVGVGVGQLGAPS